MARIRKNRPPPDTVCPQGSVECLLCGRHFHTMGPHLTHAHGITAREYRVRFPGASTQTADARERSRASGRLGNEILARQGGMRRKVTFAT